MAGSFINVQQVASIGIVFINPFFGSGPRYTDRPFYCQHFLYVVALGILVGGQLGNALFAHELPQWQERIINPVQVLDHQHFVLPKIPARVVERVFCQAGDRPYRFLREAFADLGLQVGLPAPALPKDDGVQRLVKET